MGRRRANFLSLIFIVGAIAEVCHSLPSLRVKADERPVVDVPQGRIVGITEIYENQTIYSFKAIPFAQPPENELRFMAPQPADSWDGELDASSQPSSCPQLRIMGSEDCLYLNVYTPEGAPNRTDDLLPVMVYIYGGAYALGDVRTYDKTYRLVLEDVIVVLVQYRVGVLGFFSTGDDAAPGNQGLMDQTLGLEWVRDNIYAFGGDNSQVTLFGESAGSASTHYQILTPYAQGLFHRGIMQSGNAFCPWSVGRDFVNTSRTIAQDFDCPLEPSEDLVSCLQGVNARRLSNTYNDFIEWNFQPFKFAPRVDGDFIPDEPARLVREGNFNKVPTIIGTTKDEGSLVSGEMYAFRNLIDELMTHFTQLGPISLELYDDEDPVNTAYAVYNYYLGGINITDENADQLTKLYTDRLFHMNIDWLVQEQSDQVDVYVFQLDHRGIVSLLDLYEVLGLDLPQAKEWVCHGDDLPYIFGRIPLDPDERPDDAEVSRIFVKTFTNFAKYGNPTPDASELGFIWPTASSENLQHLSIDVPPSIQEDSRQDERAFWESLPLRINSILH